MTVLTITRIAHSSVLIDFEVREDERVKNIQMFFTRSSSLTRTTVL